VKYKNSGGFYRVKPTSLNQLIIGIKGAGEMASAVAWRLFCANIQKIFMMEVEHPLAVRRAVSFCEVVYEGSQKVEDVEAVKVSNPEGIREAWDSNKIAVIVDPQWRSLQKLRPDVTVDAIVAKKNLGTNLAEASLVVGLGPGFSAGKDVHLVIETNRGHNLGRIITTGSAEANTGIPGSIGGHDVKRVLRAPAKGIFSALRSIGDLVKSGEVIGSVENLAIPAEIDGSLRGLIRSGTNVTAGLKLGDIDPRGKKEFCYTISDKARAIAGSVLEAVLRIYN
jgi:xanthine dehydrogenase accessory factor